MTREEAHEFMTSKDKKYIDADIVRVCLNIVYDSFESRTCESCKHASPYDDREDGVFCTHGSIWARQAITYGCNEWKDK